MNNISIDSISLANFTLIQNILLKLIEKEVFNKNDVNDICDQSIVSLLNALDSTSNQDAARLIENLKQSV